jgi:hypothetical protein
MAKPVLSFFLPGVGNGTGYLIQYGGIAQFSISFEANTEPARFSVRYATEANLTVNGKTLDNYVIEGEDIGSPVLVEKTEPVVTPEVVVEPSQEQHLPPDENPTV